MERPRSVLIYSIILWVIASLYIIGGANSLGSESEIIRALTPWRLTIFGICAVGFVVAGILLLRRIAFGRVLVVASVLLHMAYVIHYNLKVLYKNGEPTTIEWIGMSIVLGVIFMVMLAIGIIPFTPKFSRFLKSRENYAEQDGGLNDPSAAALGS